MSTETPLETPARPPLISRRASNYVRFSIKNAFILIALVLFSLGGAWIYVIPVISTSLLLVAEELMADIDATEEMPPVWYLNLMLWASLPLLTIITIAFINVAGDGIPIVDAMLRPLGFDPASARAATHWQHVVSGIVSLGIFYGLAGLNVAHELVHRTNSTFDQIVGRMLLAFTWDTGYAIDHVFGHHRNVGTELDPSTARRGEYIGWFVARAPLTQNLSALRIERERLARKGIPDRPWTNRYWRGQAISVAYVVACWLLGGWVGALVFIFSASTGKFFHTCITYVEHYGLVRIPGTRVEPRHSWSSNRRISLGILYNAPLHAEHHMFAGRPFWDLHKGDEQTPLLPFGSVPMFMIAFVPPLWDRLVNPALAEWDKHLASPEERAYLAQRGQLLG